MEQPFLMVVLIVFFAIGGGILREHLRGRRLALQQRADEQTPEVTSELADLRNRVAVLEQIVTDGKYDLRRELERL